MCFAIAANPVAMIAKKRKTIRVNFKRRKFSLHEWSRRLRDGESTTREDLALHFPKFKVKWLKCH